MVFKKLSMNHLVVFSFSWRGILFHLIEFSKYDKTIVKIEKQKESCQNVTNTILSVHSVYPSEAPWSIKQSFIYPIKTAKTITNLS